MIMKGFTKDGKFHPITDYKKVRKKRDQSVKSTGIKVERKARGIPEFRSRYREQVFEDRDYSVVVEERLGFMFKDSNYKGFKDEDIQDGISIEVFNNNNGKLLEKFNLNDSESESVEKHASHVVRQGSIGIKEDNAYFDNGIFNVEIKPSGEDPPLGLIIDVFDPSDDELINTFTFWRDDLT